MTYSAWEPHHADQSKSLISMADGFKVRAVRKALHEEGCVSFEETPHVILQPIDDAMRGSTFDPIVQLHAAIKWHVRHHLMSPAVGRQLLVAAGVPESEAL